MLATIPGIGITMAILISTEIDGVEHFYSPSKLCSYAGLLLSTYLVLPTEGEVLPER